MTDEKHYVTMNNYCLYKYHKKTYRISLNGNFSCPNRDGTLSTIGCIFCSEMGSGDFAGDKSSSIKEQFEEVKKMMETKWPDGYYIAYFQANTNTYGSLSKLKEVFGQIVTECGLLNDKIKVLSIATRPDCLDEEKIEYLKELNKHVEVWVELGFQTSNEKTAAFINRGYNNECFIKAVKALHQAGLYVVVHMINGLPLEIHLLLYSTNILVIFSLVILFNIVRTAFPTEPYTSAKFSPKSFP